MARNEGAADLDLLRGPADRQRPAGHPPRRGAHLQGRLPALPDHAGLPGQPQGRLGLPRPAGRAGGREGARLLRQARHRGLRHRRVQRALPRVGAAPRRPLGGDDRPDGLLDRHAAALPDDGHAVRRVGLVVAEADLRQGPAGRGLPGRAVLPPLRHRALRPRARAGLRDGHRPVGLRPLPADLRPARRPGRACWSGRRRRGRWCPTPRSPCTPDVDLRRRDRRRRDRSSSPSRCSSTALGEGWTVQRPVHRLRDGALDLPAALRPGRLPGRAAPTSSCSPTTSPPRTAPAWCTSPPPSARTTSRSCRAYGLPVVNPVDGRRPLRRRRPAGRRPVLQARRRRPRRATSRRAGCCSGTCRTSTATRTAGAATPRCSTTRSRPGTSAPPRSRTRCCARTSRPTGSPRRSSTAATATGWRTTSTGRCRAAATGARPLPIWRCAEGHQTCVGSLAELGELTGTDQSGLDPHRPFVDDVTFACPATAAAHAPRRVPEVIDAWYDSGSMPFAQWGYPHVAGLGADARAGLPGRLHLRGDRPDPRLVLHADGRRHAGLRPVVVPERALPGPHPGRGRPQDVQAPRQHPRADPADGRARRRRGALVHGRRRLAVGGPAGRARHHPGDGPQGAADLLEHGRLPGALRQRRRAGRPATRRPRSPSARCWTAGRSPRRTGWCSDVTDGARGLRHPARRLAALGVRRRPVQLVRAPLAPALLGRRPGGAGDPARVPVRRHAADGPAGAVHHRAGLAGPVRRSTSTELPGVGAPGRLAAGRRRAGRRRPGRAGAAGPPTGRARPGGPGRGQGADPPAAAPRAGRLARPTTG